MLASRLFDDELKLFIGSAQRELGRRRIARRPATDIANRAPTCDAAVVRDATDLNGAGTGNADDAGAATFADTHDMVGSADAARTAMGSDIGGSPPSTANTELKTQAKPESSRSREAQGHWRPPHVASRVLPRNLEQPLRRVVRLSIPRQFV